MNDAQRPQRSRVGAALLVLLAVVCLTGAGWLNGHLRRLREQAGTHSQQVAAIENAPPLVVFTTVVLGGFRGLLTDILWLRVSYLQDTGEYLELVQLSDWITKLEPYNDEVWAFHAWNMAYNVSVMMSDYGDRWRWLQNSLHLLRDAGLTYNPGSAALRHQIGWLHQHKLGGATDHGHDYYKQTFAGELSPLLGDGYLARLSEQQRRAAAATLSTEYKLDLAVMAEIDERHGPVNWLSPFAHSLYWGYQAQAYAKPGSFRELQCDRMVYQSLMLIFARGDVRWDGENQRWQTGPSVRILPRTLAVLDAMLVKHGPETMQAPMRTFIADAIEMLMAAGLTDETEQLFDAYRAKLGLDAQHTSAGDFLRFMNRR